MAMADLETLGALEHLVLLAIVRIGSESYGVTIIDELQSHAKRPILRPSVYLALKRLEGRGFIKSRMGEPEARRGGRARRHFEATAAGLKVLRESHRMLESLSDGVAFTKRG
jgi:PadR family transcriptional regulator, regulatory protein PadR